MIRLSCYQLTLSRYHDNMLSIFFQKTSHTDFLVTRFKRHIFVAFESNFLCKQKYFFLDIFVKYEIEYFQFNPNTGTNLDCLASGQSGTAMLTDIL
jgi:hypothetical protein